jgi:Protein of unknown function (DUF1488)
VPLRRYDDAYHADLDGVQFRMVNDEEEIIVYHVTREALSDRGAASNLTAGNDDVEIFLRFREEIERVAASKFAAGAKERVVTTADLTPPSGISRWR